MPTTPDDLQKQAEINNQIGEPSDDRVRTPEKQTEILNKIADSGAGAAGDATGAAVGGSIAGMTFKLPQQRLEALLKKGGILPEGAEVGPKKTYGEVDGTRVIVAASEGFMIPTNYRVRIFPPTGVDAEDGQVTLNATEYESLRRNRSLNGTNIQRAKNAQNNSIEAMLNGGAPAPGKLSTQSNSLEGTIRQLYNLSVGNSGTAFAMGKGEQYGRNGTATRLDMFCNQVQIPEKQIQFGLYRHYGSPTPHPTAIQYGQLTTQFYSDGIMSIKKFFDAWQKLVYNDVTGNTNYYKEYIGSMQILTQKNVLVNEVSAGISGNNIENENGFLSGLRKGAKAVQGAVQDFTKSYNNFFAGNEPGDAGHFMEENKYTGFKTEVRDTYGVKVFECWPSIVGQVQFGHDMVDQIGRLDVTWAYKSWDAFGFSVSGRGDDVPLSIGEVRNEKDGFPFLEDLPPELGGPLTEGLTGAINAIPIGRATGGKMFF